jgi:hypothetical protein
MADMDNRSPLAPTAVPPSVVSSTYEVKEGNNTARRGPLRFEEGLATDPSIPGDFITGIRQGYLTGPHGTNQNVYEKSAVETMQDRAHLGSASWVEAPTYLGAFAGGASNEAEKKYIQVDRSGGRYERMSPATVRD